VVRTESLRQFAIKKKEWKSQSKSMGRNGEEIEGSSESLGRLYPPQPGKKTEPKAKPVWKADGHRRSREAFGKYGNARVMGAFVVHWQTKGTVLTLRLH